MNVDADKRRNAVHLHLTQLTIVGDYLSVNAANWDARAEAHMGPGGFQVNMLDDPAWLSSVVRFDQPRLGDVRGLDGLHLQCHLGTDTISLARLGARMTGLDRVEPIREVCPRPGRAGRCADRLCAG